MIAVKYLPLALLGAAAFAAGAWWLVQKTPAAPEGKASPLLVFSTRDAAPESARAAVAPQAVRVWPRSSTERARLTPDPGDEARLDGMILADGFDALLAQARTDPAFSHSLAFALHQCSTEEKSMRRLELDLRAFNDERDAKAIARFDSTYSKCRGLSAERIALRFDLEERAARAGVLQAQLYYGSYIPAPDAAGAMSPATRARLVANAQTFVEAAARSGDPEGLYAGYSWYANGSPAHRDLVRAYGYAYQYTLHGPSADAQRILDNLARRMTPEQLRRARASNRLHASGDAR